jgi:PPK2 family polyphosphate:nucleotide phosphotransferase
MQDPAPSPYLVPFDGSFSQESMACGPPKDAPSEKKLRERREELTKRLKALQPRFFADGDKALLVVFQAMDAAGKDGTIRAVLSGVNPAGCEVHSFGVPSKEELAHDFLWRTTKRLPARGKIGIFNRSHYEEVLAVRVHPHFLAGQRVDLPDNPEALWDWRLEAIAAHEKHLARNGTIIVKFWLKVSREEQRKRLLQRIEDPDRNWKANAQDVVERRHWADYHHAYEEALRATSRPWAPWYCIPADDKDYMRMRVAEVLVETIERSEPKYPVLGKAEMVELTALRHELEG